MKENGKETTNDDAPAQTPGVASRRIRWLLILCVVADLALLSLALYDYYVNESQWLLIVTVAFALLVVVAAITAIFSWRDDGKVGGASTPAAHARESDETDGGEQSSPRAAGSGAT